MIPRYTPKAFAELWSDKTRYGIWLDVELAACQAMETEGLVPKGTAASIRAKNITLDPSKIDEIERTTVAEYYQRCFGTELKQAGKTQLV